MPLAPPDRRVTIALRLLRRVFARLPSPLLFRLWDGTDAPVGAPGDGGFAVVFHSRPVFRRILRNPTPFRFGEAYIAGEIDIEGDVFAAMRVANEIEALRVPFGTRLAVLAGLFRL